MMKKVILIILCITTLVSACNLILRLPDYGDNDVYEQNKIHLQEAYPITFMEITADEIKSRHCQEVFLFSDWCPYCYTHLSDLTSDTKGNVMYISCNYDIPFMVKHFTAFDTIYILSNAYYGSIESQKILKFTSELTGSESKNAGIPQQFVYDESSRLFKSKNLK